MRLALPGWYDIAVTRPEPKHKGVGVLAVVKGLKANPRALAQVPAQLANYLSQPILPSGWYPERDYNALIELLARHVDSTATGGDVWGFFGRAAARHDIAGQRDATPSAGEKTSETAGIYRRFRDGIARDVASMFLRLEKIWSLYHDTGRLTVARHPEHAALVSVRVSGFRFAFRGLIDLQTGFMTEYGRLLGLPIQSTFMRSIGSGEPLCEWHCRLPPTAEHVAALGTLPGPRSWAPVAAR